MFRNTSNEKFFLNQYEVLFMVDTIPIPIAPVVPNLDRIAALEAKVQSLELEKRLTLIHNKWATFDGKDHNSDFLDGVAFCIANYKPDVKGNAIACADVTPAAKVGKRVGAIDEDAVKSKGASDL